MTSGPDPRKKPEAKRVVEEFRAKNSSRGPIRFTAMPACRSSNRRPKPRNRLIPERWPYDAFRYEF
jgi:hypothetical protein